MAKIKIILAGYTDTVSVYINDELLQVNSLLKDAKYNCDAALGICKVRVVKSSGVLEPQWKKKVALNWLSLLSGVPDFTLKEAQLEANISCICFDVEVTDIDEIIELRLKLSSTGFKFIQGAEKCSDVKVENKVDDIALKRIKLVYFLPAIFLAVSIVSCLISIMVYAILKTEILLFMIVLVITILLSSLFIYGFKRTRHRDVFK